MDRNRPKNLEVINEGHQFVPLDKQPGLNYPDPCGEESRHSDQPGPCPTSNPFNCAHAGDSDPHRHANSAPGSPTLVNFSRTQTNSYWQTYSRSDGVQDYATDLLIDQAGRVWFGTSAGVTVFDGQTWLTYTQADGLPPGAIKDIGVDPAGHVWLVTSTGSEFEFEAAYQCALGTAAYGRRGCSVRSPTGTVLGFAPQSKVRDRWVWAEGERDVQ